MSESALIIYLATPYTHEHARVMELRFQMAAEIAGSLIKQGHIVYSPICHTHPIAVHGGIDQADSKMWVAYDKPFMAVCDELWVLKMPGWEESKGIKREVADFEALGKPVKYLEW